MRQGGPAGYSRGVSERVDDYDYSYPPEAVAQVPAEQRDQARLLRIERGAVEAGREPIRHDGRVADLPDLLRPGDLLVVNETRVVPARLVARRASGGRVSVLVLDWDGDRATALLGARGSLQPGEELDVDGDGWRLEQDLGGGRWQLVVARGRPVEQLLDQAGRMPLPPYIRRDAELDQRDALDRERYQTTFAGTGGRAVAAPTAGLHLTPELLERLADRGVELGRLCLDVGEGTFRPLRGEVLGEHVMHRETFEVTEALAERYAAARREGRRVVAVGTTVVRTLEATARDGGAALTEGPGSTDLFLRPGHAFQAVDALLTNFHQPRSTLLVLVSAFAGRETIQAGYAEALRRGFRFFSYGDATLLDDGR